MALCAADSNCFESGATAKTMLVTAAAQALNVPAEECYAENGTVIHKTKRKKIVLRITRIKGRSLTCPF